MIIRTASLVMFMYIHRERERERELWNILLYSNIHWVDLHLSACIGGVFEVCDSNITTKLPQDATY